MLSQRLLPSPGNRLQGLILSRGTWVGSQQASFLSMEKVWGQPCPERGMQDLGGISGAFFPLLDRGYRA